MRIENYVVEQIEGKAHIDAALQCQANLTFANTRHISQRPDAIAFNNSVIKIVCRMEIPKQPWILYISCCVQNPNLVGRFFLIDNKNPLLVSLQESQLEQ